MIMQRIWFGPTKYTRWAKKYFINVKVIANFTLNFQRNELNLRMSASYAKMVKKSMLTVQFYLDIVPNYVWLPPNSLAATVMALIVGDVEKMTTLWVCLCLILQKKQSWLF